MDNLIAVSKEPRWMRPLGVVLLLPGAIALIPFKADYLQVWDIPFFSSSVIGALILLRAAQQIGWRLNLEDNVLYYQKFNLYSNWKKRRSQEFALSLSKITKMGLEGQQVVIAYQPSKKLRFNVTGLDSLSLIKLDRMIVQINSRTAENQ
tara:strand:+ start:171 stop:620 length:450 start_codon:yes stop_codon:yes gene_type:complete